MEMVALIFPTRSSSLPTYLPEDLLPTAHSPFDMIFLSGLVLVELQSVFVWV
jgi:hypothetical protein